MPGADLLLEVSRGHASDRDAVVAHAWEYPGAQAPPAAWRGHSRAARGKALGAPARLPFIFAGVKTAMTLALIGAIAGGSEGCAC